MGFSQQTKDELGKVISHSRCCMMAELAALAMLDGNIVYRPERAFDIRLTNAAAAKKVFILMKKLFHPEMALSVRKQMRLKKARIYTISLLPQGKLDGILRLLGITDGRDPVQHSCCPKGFVRGAFLGRGSITNPERNYHLEFSVEDPKHARQIGHYIEVLGYTPKLSHRKGNKVVYLKEADQISGLLSVLGAHSALLALENVRVMKDMRNDVNRLVNCETANVDKTVEAAMEQKTMIETIFSKMNRDDLPDGLLQIAKLRLDNPYASLKELGQMLQPPLGKSGVNHRLRRLKEIAERLGD